MGAQGTATLNFGAFPGASDTSQVVTGQGGILSSSLVEAWILPAQTADHSSDEHLLETFKVFAGNIVPGTGFTIYGINTSEKFEWGLDMTNNAVGDLITRSGPAQVGRGTLIYGAWNIAWVWN